MVAYRIAFLAGAVAALPLNINLGAYSPALVVGDGEISFGGQNDVSGLMTVLEGAAVNAANGAAQNAAAPAPATAPAAAPAGAAPATAAPAQPEIATDGTVANSVDPNLQQQASQIAALQGMGKAVLPRDEEPSSNLNKRQLSGFDRALTFAEAALVKGPKIQLGTGEGGAGVGIIIDNNPQAAARPGTGLAGRKRSESSASQRVKVTTMYVRSGIPASLQNGGSTLAARSVDGEEVEPRWETIQIAPAKREASPNPNAIDAVNLNVNGDQGVTMTFVETVEDEEDDDL